MSFDLLVFESGLEPEVIQFDTENAPRVYTIDGELHKVTLRSAYWLSITPQPQYLVVFNYDVPKHVFKDAVEGLSPRYYQ
ncbi:hypothetical protein AC790_13280 [Pantoea sp. RIT-PI-b]|uniref:hypothetical protein n=1 Tax=Pantoea sp. RIT-PI-b TaxID=1681195 RepID=UPI00067609C3|nr:hypothetical protein [Pantoea sp. RIT-PI-b]KNC11538.1 hypothetical protein AC790_13280 [Pantoea sp. RIT-PI-b]